jgi:hypothetical protein
MNEVSRDLYVRIVIITTISKMNCKIPEKPRKLKQGKKENG